MGTQLLWTPLSRYLRHPPPCSLRSLSSPALGWPWAPTSTDLLRQGTLTSHQSDPMKFLTDQLMSPSHPTPSTNQPTSQRRRRRACLLTTIGKWPTSTPTTITTTTPSLMARLPRASTEFCCPTEGHRS